MSDFLQNVRRKFDVPDEVRTFLDDCPPEGSGVHRFIFIGALKLSRYKTREDAFALLRSATWNCSRDTSREIEEAISAVYSGDFDSGSRVIRLKVDYKLVDFVVAKKLVTVAELRRRSKQRIRLPMPAEYYIDIFFRAERETFVCAGHEPNSFTTQSRRDWDSARFPLYRQSYVVPAPMNAKWGRRKYSDNMSQRTDNNTDGRWYAVLEWDFDFKGPWKDYLAKWHEAGLNSLDVCATLICRVAEQYPLSNCCLESDY
jgi:hypothetical protein